MRRPLFILYLGCDGSEELEFPVLNGEDYRRLNGITIFVQRNQARSTLEAISRCHRVTDCFGVERPGTPLRKPQRKVQKPGSNRRRDDSAC
jgi:hypothetical protein